MHAIRLHEFGPASNLILEELPDPQPGEGQVRIAVEAAGVHVLDTTIRSGASGGPFPLPELPTIPGREVAGAIDAVGPGVDRSLIGRRVVAHLGIASSGYASLAVANEPALQFLPEHLDAAAAVAMIGTGRTTAGVLQAAAITPTDVVLIPAAAGGIGSLLVQEAAHLGAFTVGLAGGSAKVASVLAIGADAAIDYRVAGWPDAVREVLGEREITLVIDGVGGEVGRAAFELLGAGGRFVIFGYTSGAPTVIASDELLSSGQTVTGALGPALLRRPGGIRELESTALARAADGIWKPLITRFPLAEAAAAHQALTDRQTQGKVVLMT
jgi:NADPH2:quinone reductase